MTISTNSLWRIQTVIRVQPSTSMWITEEDGVPVGPIEVELTQGDYYPNGTGDADDLYTMLNAQMTAALSPSANYATLYTDAAVGFKFAYSCTIGHSYVLSFADPLSTGRDAIALKNELRVTTDTISIVKAPATTYRTPIGTVVGTSPLITYRSPEEHARGVFYTDSGPTSTVYRRRRTTLTFEVGVEGRPQSPSNEINLFHDLREWWISASKGKSTRVYPDTSVEYPFDGLDSSTFDGYRECQTLGSLFAPAQVSQSRTYHTLTFEARPYE